MLAEIKSVNEAGMEYLEDTNLCVFYLDCKILHKLSKDPLSKMRVQPRFWGANSMNVVIQEEGKICAWTREVGNPFDGLASFSRDQITEARCDINSPDFLYIRFIPRGYPCSITTGLKESARPTKERRIEIASRGLCDSVSIAHFSSPNDKVFFGFGSGLMKICKKPVETVYNFDWLGTQPKIVHGFSK